MFPVIRDSYFRLREGFESKYVTDILIKKALDNKNDDGVTNGLGSLYILQLNKYLKAALTIQCRIHISLVLLNDVRYDTLPKTNNDYIDIIDSYRKKECYQTVIDHAFDALFGVERSIKRQKDLVKLLVSKMRKNRVDKRWEVVFKRFIKALYDRLNYIEKTFCHEILEATPVILLEDELKKLKHSDKLQEALFNNANTNIWEDKSVKDNTIIELTNQMIDICMNKTEDEINSVIKDVNSNYQIKLNYINAQIAQREREAERERDIKEFNKKVTEKSKAYLYDSAKKMLEKAAETAEADILSYKTTSQINSLLKDCKTQKKRPICYAILLIKFSNKLDVDKLKIVYSKTETETTGIIGGLKFYPTLAEAKKVLNFHKSKSHKGYNVLGEIVKIDLRNKFKGDEERKRERTTKEEFNEMFLNVQKAVEGVQDDYFLEYLAQECKCEEVYVTMFHIKYKSDNRVRICYGNKNKKTTQGVQNAALFRSYSQATECIDKVLENNSDKEISYKIGKINLKKYTKLKNIEDFFENIKEKLHQETKERSQIFRKSIEADSFSFATDVFQNKSRYILVCARANNKTMFITNKSNFCENYGSYCFFESQEEVEEAIENVCNKYPQDMLFFESAKVA